MNKLDWKEPHIKCLKGKCIPETPPNYMGKYFTWIDNYPPKYFIPTYSNGQCTGKVVTCLVLTEENREFFNRIRTFIQKLTP